MTNSTFKNKATSAFILIVSLLCFCGMALSACSGGWSKEEDNFVETYTEVLIAREQFARDTALANTSVRTILKQHGFTEETFRQRFSELSGKPEKLRQMLDSSRSRARKIAEREAEKERKEAEQKQKNDSVSKPQSLDKTKPPQDIR
jgi:hypothetical protein